MLKKNWPKATAKLVQGMAKTAGVLEKLGVLLQLVGHLINDETAARRQRVVCFLEERAFLVDFKNTERNA